jgi:hypothetical protein
LQRLPAVARRLFGAARVPNLAAAGRVESADALRAFGVVAFLSAASSSAQDQDEQPSYVETYVEGTQFERVKPPQPTQTGSGCWEWHYAPGQPIPEDAKVVPGQCPTPDGRCYVVPSSGCFEITGVENADEILDSVFSQFCIGK